MSKKTQDVVIQVFNERVACWEAVSCNTGPGGREGRDLRASEDPNEAPRYCKFALDGKKADFRASILTRTPGFGSISALPAQ